MKEQLKNHTLEQVLDTEKFKAFYMRPPGGGRMMSTLFVFTPEGIVIMGDLCPGHGGGGGAISALGYGLNWFAGHLHGSYLCEKFLRKGWHAELAKEWCLDMAGDVRHGLMDHERCFNSKHLESAANDRESIHDDLVISRKDLKDAISRADAADVDMAKKLIASARTKLSKFREQLIKLREDVAVELERIGADVEGGMDIGRFREELEEVFPDMDVADYSPGWGYNPTDRMLLCALQEKFAELYNSRAPVPAQ